MNKALNENLNRYYKDILSALNCSKRQKTAFLNELKGQIEEFTESSPETDIEEIITLFGSPEEISEGFIKELTGAEIRKRLSIKKVLAVTALAVILIWAVFAVISLIDVHTEAHGYFTEAVLYIQNIWGGGAV